MPAAVCVIGNHRPIAIDGLDHENMVITNRDHAGRRGGAGKSEPVGSKVEIAHRMTRAREAAAKSKPKAKGTKVVKSGPKAKVKPKSKWS